MSEKDSDTNIKEDKNNIKMPNNNEEFNNETKSDKLDDKKNKKAKKSDELNDEDIENSYHSFIVTDDDIVEAQSKGKISEFGDVSYSNRKAARENKKLDKLAAKRERERIKQAERDLVTPDQEKKKKRRILIILILFFTFTIVGGVALYLYNINNAITILKLNNVSATIEVNCYVIDKIGNTRTPVNVNGSDSTKLVFNHNDTDENNILERKLVFDDLNNMSGTSTIVFFYSITNTSDIGSMYVDLAKLQADDHNFNFEAYYRISKGDTANELYESSCYTNNGKLYKTLRESNDEVNPVEKVYLINKFEVKPGETLTLRLNAQITNPILDARCNCNFRFDLFNSNYMTSEME